MEINDDFFGLIKEFKKVFCICDRLVSNQKALYNLIQRKLLKIDYIIYNLLKLPLILNNKQIRNIINQDENALPPKFYSKQIENDFICSKNKLNEIKKRVDIKIKGIENKYGNFNNYVSINDSKNSNFEMENNIPHSYFSLHNSTPAKAALKTKKKTKNEKNPKSKSLDKKEEEILSSIEKKIPEEILSPLKNIENTANYVFSTPNKFQSTEDPFNGDNSIENVDFEKDNNRKFISKSFSLKMKESAGQIYSPMREKQIIKNLMEKAYTNIKNNHYHHGIQFFAFFVKFN